MPSKYAIDQIDIALRNLSVDLHPQMYDWAANARRFALRAKVSAKKTVGAVSFGMPVALAACEMMKLWDCTRIMVEDPDTPSEIRMADDATRRALDELLRFTEKA